MLGSFDRERRIFRITCAIMTAALLAAMMAAGCVTANADSSVIGIKVDGKKLAADADPIIVEDRTLVPVSTILDAMGGTSQWEDSTKTVILKSNGTTVVLKIGSVTATVNDVEKRLDVAPRLVTVNAEGGGRTMVPIRFIGESFGYGIDWENSTRTVLITSPVVPVTIQSISTAIENGQPDVDSDNTVTLVAIKSTEDLRDMDYSGSWLTDPYRYYIDIANSELGKGSEDKYQSVSGSYVTGVRTGTIANYTVRVVVDTSRRVEPAIYYVNDGRTLVMAFAEVKKPDSSSSGNQDNKGSTGSTDSDSKDSDSKDSDSKDSNTGSSADNSNSNDNSGNTGGSGDGNSDSDTEEPWSEPVYEPDEWYIGSNDTETVQGTIKRDTIDYYSPYADGKLIVAIDPGHGATTGGKRSPDSTLMEWEFNRVVAYKLKDLLEEAGIEVVMTVDYDDMTDPSLADRVAIANDYGNVDLFVSIHANAYGEWTTANGWEIYSYINGGVSEAVCRFIETSTIYNIPELRDRGCKTANFYVIKNTEMPAVLIEHGFYTNIDEVELLKSDAFRDRLANADAEGILNFFESFK